MSLVQLVALRLSHQQGPSLAAVTAAWLHVRGSTHSNARTEHAVLLSDLLFMQTKSCKCALAAGASCGLYQTTCLVVNVVLSPCYQSTFLLAAGALARVCLSEVCTILS